MPGLARCAVTSTLFLCSLQGFQHSAAESMSLLANICAARLPPLSRLRESSVQIIGNSLPRFVHPPEIEIHVFFENGTLSLESTRTSARNCGCPLPIFASRARLLSRVNRQ
jgi:hypothetical protein